VSVITYGVRGRELRCWGEDWSVVAVLCAESSLKTFASSGGGGNSGIEESSRLHGLVEVDGAGCLEWHHP
jgi:hypothetical protein